MNDTDSPETARTRRLLALVAVVALVAIGLLFLLRPRKEKTVPGTAAAPAPAAESAPASAPMQGPPVIREKAQPGAAPYSGVLEPFEAEVDGRGRLWVLDSNNSRIHVFDSEGGALSAWGGPGSEKYAFRGPSALAIHGENVYVADSWNGRVQRFDLSGRWRASAAGFFGPRGVAVSPNGDVWVADTGNSKIFRCDAALRRCEEMGRPGSEAGAYRGPVSIAVAPDGAIYVTDPGNGRVQVLDEGGDPQGAWSLPWLTQAWEARLETDERGTVFLSHPNTGEVVALDSSGAVARRWTTTATQARIVRPVGLAITRGGALFVMDTGTRRIVRVETGAAASP